MAIAHSWRGLKIPPARSRILAERGGEIEPAQEFQGSLGVMTEGAESGPVAARQPRTGNMTA